MRGARVTPVFDDGLQHDLSEWCHPLVNDQINYFYQRQLDTSPEKAREIASLHFQMWRHVLRREEREAQTLRRVLLARTTAAGALPTLIDKADESVMNELMDVILNRFRRTPSIAKIYSRSLLDSATALVRARQAAC